MLISITEQGLNWMYSWCIDFPDFDYWCKNNPHEKCELKEYCRIFNEVKKGN